MDLDEIRKLALLKALAERDDDDDDDSSGASDNLFISCIRDAYNLLNSPKGENPRFRRDITDYIIDPFHQVFGDSDELHNLLSTYLRMGDYYNCIRVADHALTMYPYSNDLIADGIHACGQGAQFAKGNEYIRRAYELPQAKYWNWRMYLFIIEFYKNELRAAHPDDMEDLLNKALTVCHEYQANLPLDERGYNSEAELWIYANDPEKAKAILERAIFTGLNTDRGLVKLIAPQCCITYLSVLETSTDYEKIIQVCDKGICFTLQEQPSSAVEYFLYIKAMAMDADCIACGYRVPNDIQETLNMYQAAYDLCTARQRKTYANVIRQRFSILAQNPVNPVAVRLVERSLSVKDAAGD